MNYQTGLTVFDSSFVKFNTRNGEAEKSCNIENGYCYNWEEYRQRREKNRKENPSPTVKNIMEKKLKHILQI